MAHNLVPVAVGLICLGMAATALASVAAVRGTEALDWTRYMVPLPKSITITGKVEVPPSQVAIVFQGESGLLTEQTLKELQETIGTPDVPAAAHAFTLNLQVGGAESEPLKELKNADQAYRIFAPGKSKQALHLVALSSHGLYYAAKTLQQLIAAKKTEPAVTMPILEVTDWPDMAVRGLWGTDNYLHLRWLADRKMNICEQISVVGIDENGKPFARIQDQRDPLLTEAPHYGIDFTPVIPHLEKASQFSKLFESYPELKGKSEHPGVMCYSQPGVADIIAGWMADLVSLPHVTSLDCWMTENLLGKTSCQCDQCKDQEWTVLEARAIVAAWKKAQQQLGRPFTLRVLTAQGTEYGNPQVFADLPPEVQRSYYHSLLTYNAMKRPQLRHYLSLEAAKGRWVGVVPTLSAACGQCEPFTGAAFVDYRMTEYVDKGMSGLIGYATPRVHYCGFNVEAAAEWTWNNKGRSTREFAFSYAVRQGYQDPKKFAEWSETIGPVAWDIYGSGFPHEERRAATGTVAGRLRDGTLPKLGYVLWEAFPAPWGSINSEQQLHADVESAAKGVRLAREMGIPTFLQESLVVDGYIRALQALYQLKQVVAPQGGRVSRKSEAHRWYLRYVDGLTQAKTALPEWEDTLRTAGEPQRLTDDIVKVIDTMLHQMKEVAAEKGF